MAQLQQVQEQRRRMNARGGKNILVTIMFLLVTTTTTKTAARAFVVGVTRPHNGLTTTTRTTAAAGGGVHSKRALSSAFLSRTTASTTTTTSSRRSKTLLLSSTSSSSSSSNEKLVWTTDEVRKTFCQFFEESPRNHTFVASSPCAPLADPTLLFTNAGMNQFKPVFLGQVAPDSPLAALKRAVNSQKCIRAGGKHNDLEDVGVDTYHHTFFEMLGTWSFGDYFKKDAINYAWQLLTQVYQLDPNRLYATYFQGNDSLEPDYEARDLWLQYLPAERVIGCSARDNFWEMGETGPCGPCSEVHYDRIGKGRNAAALVNADDPTVIEIWNIVFIQYNRESETALSTLPAKHIDTGMGLERLTSILQDKLSNYDIDVFQPLFRKLEQMTDRGPYTGKVAGINAATKDDPEVLKDTAYRAIADHARCLTFALADGVIPNNEGRGYVLRRILRRACRYGQQILACPPGFFTSLIPVVVETFGTAYPELQANQQAVMDLVREEEEAFSSMLQRGIKYFEEMQTDLRAASITTVSGEQAFYLYDTLGFPVDLTQLMAAEAGLAVDTAAFEQTMQAAKERSRAAQKAAKAAGTGLPTLELQAEQTAWLAKQPDMVITDDSYKYKWDVALPAQVLAVYTPAGFVIGASASLAQGEYAGLVLDKSSYYAEAGGQEADVGVLEIVDAATGQVTGTFAVTDVQVYAGYILHKGVVSSGSVSVGSSVVCKVDYDRRRLIAPNHSMTHVLNAALRNVLGDAVDQRGSLCNDEKLRFDFSYKKAMTVEQLEQVERTCQTVIAQKEPVKSQVMPLKDAQAIPGVRAVFGEVYPDPVRVVTIGDETSIEFCGGTHLGNTAEAEAFCLVEETAVAKGIRRITAVTKQAAKEALARGDTFQALVAELDSLNAETTVDLDKRAGAIRKELDAALVSASLKATLRARIEGIQKKATDAKKKALQKRVNDVLNGIKATVEAAVAAKQQVLVLNLDIGADAKASQQVMNTVKSMAPELAFMGITEEEPGSGGKVMAFAIVPDSLITKEDGGGQAGGLKADEWVRAALESCDGRGGGKAASAQAQAKECNNVNAVLEAANAFAESKIQAARVA